MPWPLILKTGMCTVDIWHRYVHYVVMYLTLVVIWWCPWQVAWEKAYLLCLCTVDIWHSYFHRVVMYLTRMVFPEIKLWSFGDILWECWKQSWICSWHCYVYNMFRRQVCWWFLCEIVINIVMYITSVFSTCWWYFQRLSCGQLFDILWECWKQSWICSWHCYVYNVSRWQVCLVVLV